MLKPIILSTILLAPLAEAATASWYGGKFHGRTTASGEKYDKWAMTAAHKTLPFGTMVRVTNIVNNKSAVVRRNDRGPFIKGRVIDLSQKANQKLECDLCPVKLTVIK